MGLTSGIPGRSPEPEQVFLVWLLMQPVDVDLAHAARSEIERLDRYSGGHNGSERLRRLFCELVTAVERRTTTGLGQVRH